MNKYAFKKLTKLILGLCLVCSLSAHASPTACKAAAKNLIKTNSVPDLKPELKKFLAKWKDNAQLVDDVRFSFKAEGGSVKHSDKKVLVISTSSLNETQKKELLDSYLELMEKNTISFPLNESQGHLHSRFGAEDVDWYFNSNAEFRTFEIPSGRKLEPVISLSDNEAKNLSTYLENARTKGASLLGSSEYDGAASGQTKATLSNNKPTKSGEGHNCTSWICTAPIGENHKALLELAGATRKIEVHTNPGWWSYFLTGGAPKERVPFVIYWTNQTLAQTLEKVKSKADFPNWNFGLH